MEFWYQIKFHLTKLKNAIFLYFYEYFILLLTLVNMKKILVVFSFLIFTSKISAQSNLDNSFNSSGNGPDNDVYTSAIQTDGKILIGGIFKNYNGISKSRLARLNEDGSIDPNFNVGGIGPDSNVHVIIIQPDGKILVGGDFTKFNGVSKRRIIRLNSDGTIDPTFNGTGTGANFAIYDIAVQADAKIIIAGVFSSFNGNSRNCIARLNSNGSLDASFFIGNGANNTVSKVHLLGDGKIIITGSFTTFNGLTANHIARLTSSGTLDGTYVAATESNSSLFSSMVQSDGKLIIGGNFTIINNVPKNGIARLNANGSLDPTFNVGTGLNGAFNTIKIIEKDKIIIGGSFTSYNNVARKRLAVLNADGSLDSAFNTGTGPNNRVETISLQSDGKIIIGGLFDSYNGDGKKYLARLETQPTGLDDKQFNDDSKVIIYPNPNSGSFSIKSIVLKEFNLINSLGNSVGIISIKEGNDQVSLGELESGVYYIANNNNPQIKHKILVIR